ncbi:serine hydrolase domain-containing protein [Rhodohalobacter sp. 8-1]|uniref:serine hydrolase domain-containing protein n=1 Tax=Rhodohalobacter sp. 8-1 TaxID=3131972 RepID=UPI0030EDD105
MYIKTVVALLCLMILSLEARVLPAQDMSLQDLDLTKDNADEIFDQLEQHGFSGVVYIKLNQIEELKRPFGMANENLNITNTLTTIFDIGSRPIDFTKASILLLDQRQQISMEDPVSLYFDNVPVDKRSMTIQHLMSGQSGLPDFFHNVSDWDPDLAWVGRETALHRILNQDLLFEPGTDRRHSHGAFGLLAILIEKVSGLDYFEFLNENFFEPAGMSRTNEYGHTGDLSLSDFAVGGGPHQVGLPNIPPNWGPTSWLIRGSGGMYSTLDDLLKFYSYVRSTKVLNTNHNYILKNPSVNLDGTMRGFELFSAFQPEGSEAYLFLNNIPDMDVAQNLFKDLEELVFAPGF